MEIFIKKTLFFLLVFVVFVTTFFSIATAVEAFDKTPELIPLGAKICMAFSLVIIWVSISMGIWKSICEQDGGLDLFEIIGVPFAAVIFSPVASLAAIFLLCWLEEKWFPKKEKEKVEKPKKIIIGCPVKKQRGSA
jgi:hypothetical protein